MRWRALYLTDLRSCGPCWARLACCFHMDAIQQLWRFIKVVVGSTARLGMSHIGMARIRLPAPSVTVTSVR